VHLEKQDSSCVKALSGTDMTGGESLLNWQKHLFQREWKHSWQNALLHGPVKFTEFQLTEKRWALVSGKINGPMPCF